MQSRQNLRDILRPCQSHLSKCLHALSGGDGLFIGDVFQIIRQDEIEPVFFIPLCVCRKDMQSSISLSA